MKKTLFLILLIGFMGCDKSDNTDIKKNENPMIEKQEIKISSENATKEISANLNINKNPINKMIPVNLKLSLKYGKLNAEKANIEMDLTMPEMTMPKNVIKLQESLPGIYSGDAIFTMAGNWRLMTYIKYNGKKYDMYFDIKVQ